MAKITKFNRRAERVRYKIRKTSTGKIRLSVHRSGKHIYAQLIDDAAGKTLAAASSVDKELRKELKTGSTLESAKAVGELIAKRAREAKVETVVFDRGGYLFHGRIKALADAARAGGLAF